MVQPNGVGLTKELDFEEDDINKRLDNVKNIVSKHDDKIVTYYDDYFNPCINKNKFLSDHDTMSKQLEIMATYVLFLDKEDSKDANSPSLTEKDLYNRRKRETDLYTKSQSNEIGEDETQDFDMLSMAMDSDNGVNSYTDSQVKVTEDDLYLFPEMTEYFKLLGVIRFNKIIGKSAEGVDNIETFAKMSKDKMLKLFPKEKKKELKDLTKKNNPNIESNVHSDLKDTKIMLSKMFYFNEFPFSKRTNKYNRFSFHQEEHVHALIESLPSIKANGTDLTTEEGVLVYILDDLMTSDKVDVVTGRVYELYSSGYNIKEIAQLMNQEMKMEVNQRAVNRVITKSLPKLITDLYSDSFQDWYYTFVEKGKYKKCPSCNQVFLATENNFYKDSLGRYGLKSTCRKCMKN